MGGKKAPVQSQSENESESEEAPEQEEFSSQKKKKTPIKKAAKPAQPKKKVEPKPKETQPKPSPKKQVPPPKKEVTQQKPKSKPVAVVEVKQNKKKDFLPGQKYPTPEGEDGALAFYKSLYDKNPKSDMARKYCLQYGALQPQQASKLLKEMSRGKK